MQAVMKTLDRNTKINFGAEMKRKHFTLLHCGSLFPVIAYLKKDNDNKLKKLEKLLLLQKLQIKN